MDSNLTPVYATKHLKLVLSVVTTAGAEIGQRLQAATKCRWQSNLTVNSSYFPPVPQLPYTALLAF